MALHYAVSAKILCQVDNSLSVLATKQSKTNNTGKERSEASVGMWAK
jgi:hypothetical protein